jgi:hypothetical protein
LYERNKEDKTTKWNDCQSYKISEEIHKFELGYVPITVPNKRQKLKKKIMNYK